MKKIFLLISSSLTIFLILFLPTQKKLSNDTIARAEEKKEMTVYVDASFSGLPDGSSSSPYRDIYSAVSTDADILHVMIKKGDYNETAQDLLEGIKAKEVELKGIDDQKPVITTQFNYCKEKALTIDNIDLRGNFQVINCLDKPVVKFINSLISSGLIAIEAPGGVYIFEKSQLTSSKTAISLSDIGGVIEITESKIAGDIKMGSRSVIKIDNSELTGNINSKEQSVFEFSTSSLKGSINSGDSSVVNLENNSSITEESPLVTQILTLGNQSVVTVDSSKINFETDTEKILTMGKKSVLSVYQGSISGISVGFAVPDGLSFGDDSSINITNSQLNTDILGSNLSVRMDQSSAGKINCTLDCSIKLLNSDLSETESSIHLGYGSVSLINSRLSGDIVSEGGISSTDNSFIWIKDNSLVSGGIISGQNSGMNIQESEIKKSVSFGDTSSVGSDKSRLAAISMGNFSSLILRESHIKGVNILSGEVVLTNSIIKCPDQNTDAIHQGDNSGVFLQNSIFYSCRHAIFQGNNSWFDVLLSTLHNLSADAILVNGSLSTIYDSSINSSIFSQVNGFSLNLNNPDLSSDPKPKLTVKYNDFWKTNDLAPTSLPFCSPCENNYLFNPLFKNSQNGNFILLPQSPAINRGDPELSFENEPDPNGGRVDLGAYGNTKDATPSDFIFRVDDTNPDDGEQNILLDKLSAIEIYFSHKLNLDTVNNNTIYLSTPYKQIPYQKEYDPEKKILRIIPTDEFQYGENYTVRLTDKIKSDTGLSLLPLSFSFTTEKTDTTDKEKIIDALTHIKERMLFSLTRYEKAAQKTIVDGKTYWKNTGGKKIDIDEVTTAFDTLFDAIKVASGELKGHYFTGLTSYLTANIYLDAKKADTEINYLNNFSFDTQSDYVTKLIEESLISDMEENAVITMIRTRIPIVITKPNLPQGFNPLTFGTSQVRDKIAANFDNAINKVKTETIPNSSRLRKLYKDIYQLYWSMPIGLISLKGYPVTWPRYSDGNGLPQYGKGYLGRTLINLDNMEKYNQYKPETDKGKAVITIAGILFTAAGIAAGILSGGTAIPLIIAAGGIGLTAISAGNTTIDFKTNQVFLGYTVNSIFYVGIDSGLLWEISDDISYSVNQVLNNQQASIFNNPFKIKKIYAQSLNDIDLTDITIPDINLQENPQNAKATFTVKNNYPSSFNFYPLISIFDLDNPQNSPYMQIGDWIKIDGSSSKTVEMSDGFLYLLPPNLKGYLAEISLFGYQEGSDEGISIYGSESKQFFVGQTSDMLGLSKENPANLLKEGVLNLGEEQTFEITELTEDTLDMMIVLISDSAQPLEFSVIKNGQTQSLDDNMTVINKSDLPVKLTIKNNQSPLKQNYYVFGSLRKTIDPFVKVPTDIFIPVTFKQLKEGIEQTLVIEEMSGEQGLINLYGQLTDLKLNEKDSIKQSEMTLTVPDSLPAGQEILVSFNIKTQRYLPEGIYTGLLSLSAQNGNINYEYSIKVNLQLINDVKYQILINGGQQFTNSSKVNINLIYPENAEAVRFSNLENFNRAKWIEPKDKIEWKLTIQDGEKKVFAQFKLNDDTLSEIYFDSIILDTKRPQGTVKLIPQNNQTDTIKVIIDAADNLSGVAQMQINQGLSRASQWVDFSKESEFQCSPFLKKICLINVKLKDNAGNISLPIFAITLL